MNTTAYSLLRSSGGFKRHLCLVKAGILFRPWENAAAHGRKKWQRNYII